MSAAEEKVEAVTEEAKTTAEEATDKAVEAVTDEADKAVDEATDAAKKKAKTAIEGC